jgi:hypothetical protein
VQADWESWGELWGDFEGRAARLERPGATAADAIDETICWQLRGTEPFVNGAIPAARLHIPELYSGSPWKHCDRWMAYITTNPSIDSKEIFPTRADLVANGYQATQTFFQRRFDPGRRECPVVHGRTRPRPTRWVDRDSPRPRGQPTWSRAEEALRRCLGPQQGALPAPLGHIAAIVDAVPWKFAKWAAVPDELKDALIQEGRRHFETTIRAHTPAVIVATGEHVRRMMRTLYPTGIPEYEIGPGQSGTLAIGSRMIPWFGVVAPTGGKGRRFYDEMLQIAPNIRAALGIQM